MRFFSAFSLKGCTIFDLNSAIRIASVQQRQRDTQSPESSLPDSHAKLARIQCGLIATLTVPQRERTRLSRQLSDPRFQWSVRTDADKSFARSHGVIQHG